jgi:hypothetical protein
MHKLTVHLPQVRINIVTRLQHGFEVNFISIAENYSKNIFVNKHFCHFYTCIQNQIIHKLIHVDIAH